MEHTSKKNLKGANKAATIAAFIAVLMISSSSSASSPSRRSDEIPSIDEGAWSGASLGILDPGSLVILKREVLAGATYFPDRSALRVVTVESNHPDWMPGTYHSVTELPVDFEARVYLGPDRAAGDPEPREKAVLTLGCRRMSLGRANLEAAKTFFACAFYPLSVLGKEVRVYRDGRR